MPARVLGVVRPRVGVVANGEEEGKGTGLTRAAAAALRRPESGIEFKGYVEGKDVFSGDFDVIATDGFTGNVLLKTAEGAVWAFGQLLKRQIQSSRMATAGAMLMKSRRRSPSGSTGSGAWHWPNAPGLRPRPSSGARCR